MDFKPISTLIKPEFNADNHSYSFNGQPLPGVSYLMEQIGVKEPFDRTFWRQSLVRKGMTEEEAIEHMDMRCQLGIARGNGLHGYIENWIKGGQPKAQDFCPLELPSLEPYVAGFHEFLAHHEVSSVLLCEQPLVNPIAMYCGTVDCLAVTPNGLMTIDWKTTETLKKYRRQDWQCYQQVLYAGAINRCFILDQPVQQGMSVTFAEDGWKVQEWATDLFMPRWGEAKCLIWEFWHEQLELGQMTDWPGAAPRAIEAMERQWGAKRQPAAV